MWKLFAYMTVKVNKNCSHPSWRWEEEWKLMFRLGKRSGINLNRRGDCPSQWSRRNTFDEMIMWLGCGYRGYANKKMTGRERQRKAQVHIWKIASLISFIIGWDNMSWRNVRNEQGATDYSIDSACFSVCDSLYFFVFRKQLFMKL